MMNYLGAMALSKQLYSFTSRDCGTNGTNKLVKQVASTMWVCFKSSAIEQRGYGWLHEPRPISGEFLLINSVKNQTRK